MKLTKDDLSLPHLTYPSLRDDSLKDGFSWMKGKAMDDGAEGFWRIHDKLYDFTEFIDKHPGGQDWLVLTKGTDITEAFECHHISTYPEKILSNYYIRGATSPRNSPFTFKDNGFYKTLKIRVRDELKNVPKGLEFKSNRLIDILCLFIFIFALLSCLTSSYIKASSIFLSALFMAWTTICAHNFFHHKDNWRMYMFNLCGMHYREWRITHALSHHLFPNTIMDYEISVFEPVFHWLPSSNKKTYERYAPWIYSFVVYLLAVDGQIIKRIYRVSIGELKFEMAYLIPFIVPLFMFIFSNIPLMSVLIDWFLIIHVSSFLFTLIGLNAAHHHPDIFHEGDDPVEDTDFGVYQLSAVMDRVDITGSHFKVMTNFGDHALHHMFPTMDHAVLPYLYPVFHKTCEEFSTKLKMTTQMDLTLGQFKQLARNVPKKKENNNVSK